MVYPFKHGHTYWTWEQRKAHSAWIKLRQRCCNPNNPKYPRYGGRGITVSSLWINDYAAFVSHIGLPPGPTYTVGRIHNDGNYEPGNVRWETPKQQANNRHLAPVHGTHNGNSRLTEEQAKAIKLGMEQGLGWQYLSKTYSVSRSTVYGIKSGRLWGWMT